MPATLRLPPHHTNPNFHPILNGQAVSLNIWQAVTLVN